MMQIGTASLPKQTGLLGPGLLRTRPPSLPFRTQGLWPADATASPRALRRGCSARRGPRCAAVNAPVEAAPGEASSGAGSTLSTCEARAWEVVRDLENATLGGREGEGSRQTQGRRGVLPLLLQWGQELQTSAGEASASASASASGSKKQLRKKENRLMGCTAQVWADVAVEAAAPTIQGGAPTVHLRMESDSTVSSGLCQVLCRVVDGADVDDVLALGADSPALQAATALLGPAVAGPQRANGLLSMLLSVQKRTRRQLSQPGMPAGEVALESLPSILISSDGTVSAQGDFALSQAQFLNPDPSSVASLVEELARKRVGVVAHFYMDPQVQGVLVAAQAQWPHIAISDSLVMADRALKMVTEGGCTTIAVLGVDFMAENVRAVLGKAGLGGVPVVRMSEQSIGCSLADAARSEAYLQYLEEASRTPKSLHVIYINTALDTKAVAHHFLPTITCTSSNVLQTVLQAFAQVPDATVWFGPDTYMGGNLVDMLRRLATLPEEDVRALHPMHTPASLQALVPRVRFFQEGTCIVHDMFGSEVVHQLRTAYSDAFHTAHFEVPGEMFSLAMEARALGRGTVGSTQNILDFVIARTREALSRDFDERLQFVLGTESGMVTALVTAIRGELAAHRVSRGDNGAAEGPNVEVEIVFPVNPSAISATPKEKAQGSGGGGAEGAAAEAVVSSLGGALQVVPGAASGEGCSLAGGCASCPYMKMNSLQALMQVCSLVGLPDSAVRLQHYEPDKFAGLTADLVSPLGAAASSSEGQQAEGGTVADLGYQPILHMRYFQKNGHLSEELVGDIRTRWEQRQS